MMEINAKNTRMWSMMGPRATYGMSMLDLVERNKDVYALSADLGVSSGLSRLMGAYPEHYLNVGIAEQNLIGVSAGLAKEGLVPFASSFAPFVTHRCADQIRMNMGYMNLNIKAVALGSGISMSILGNSHYGLDDLSFMRSIPGMTILSPCDCAELVKCVDAAAEINGPVYIRMTGEPGMPQVYKEDFDFEVGKANKIIDGQDVLIVATGSMVHPSMKACEKLLENGISAALVDLHTIKPFDEDFVRDISNDYKMIVSVEEHSIIGGMGEEICRIVANENKQVKVVNIGLPDSYLKAGSYKYMLEKYGLTSQAIFDKIINEMKSL